MRPDPPYPIDQALAAAEREVDTILGTSFGKAFTGNGFGNVMAHKIAAAGLPDECVTHGLRKAAARRLAEADCTTNEIAAISGHATLQEVSRYTKAAEQKRLARTAINRLQAGRTNPALELPAGEPFSQTGSEGLRRILDLPMVSTPFSTDASPTGIAARIVDQGATRPPAGRFYTPPV